jgi:hypothetical protein
VSDRAHLIEVFYGQGAFLVDLIALIGDRLPGTSGAETVESVLGRVPDGFAFHPTHRRYPVVAWRFPIAFIRGPRLLRRFAAEQGSWWRSSVSGSPEMSAEAARALLVESRAAL